MFRHPKYYKELRKRNKLDQAISPEAHDGERERAPGPGPKLQALESWTLEKVSRYSDQGPLPR